MTTITTMLPATGFVRPSDKELASLLTIVATAHPREAAEIDAAEFSRAFVSVGFMFRTAAPRQDRHFIHFVDRANAFLRERWGVEGVTASALFLACRAHNDVVFRAADPLIGQLLEVGLDEHHGLRLRSPNAWRAVLKGDNLLPAMPPDPLRRQQVERGPSRVYVENPDHSWREMETLWRR